MPVSGQISIDVAGLVSVCTELLLYGVFFSLFLEFLYVVLTKRMTRTAPSKVFLTGTCIMFAIATAHIGLNMYRLLRGYVYLRETVGPVSYFNDLGRWDNIAHDALNACMTWLADGLAIYRCYIIWEKNLYVVILPALLMAVSIVSNSVALHLFTKVPLGTIFSPTLVHWMNTLYSVALVQNVYTTALISWRIWSQERSSKAVGIRSKANTSSLMPIVRIIIESAASYTAILIILIVLYALEHNGQFVMQECSVPAAGIVFTLITVRLSLQRSDMMAPTAAAVSSIGITWASSSPSSGLESDVNPDVLDLRDLDKKGGDHSASATEV